MHTVRGRPASAVLLTGLAVVALVTASCDLFGSNATPSPTTAAGASNSTSQRPGPPDPNATAGAPGSGGTEPLPPATGAPDGSGNPPDPPGSSDPGSTAGPTPATASPSPTPAPTAAPVSPTPSGSPTPRPSPEEPVPVELALRPVVSGFDRPIGVFNAGDDRMFVVEQKGAIHVVPREGDGWGTPSLFMDIQPRVACCGERGLLGLAFHPQFAQNGLFYITYSDNSHSFALEERRVSSESPDLAEPHTRRVVLRVYKPHDYHWGGGIHFGPDGYLWLAMGDGGHTGGTNAIGDPDNLSQSLESLFGKLLRIDVADPDGEGEQTYGIPPDNPYVGRDGLDEIWARGLRNPWRWSFDRRTGDIWLPDTGHSSWEEVNRLLAPELEKGGNFGWRLLEGPECYNPRVNCDPNRKTIRPLTVYPHPYGAREFDCAVTGGSVYRGTQYPAMRGRYFFGDYCSGRIWSVEAEGRRKQKPQEMANTDYQLSSMGEDVNGELYVTDITSGTVLQLTGTER